MKERLGTQRLYGGLGTGLRWTALGQSGALIIQLVMAIPLTRLLGPRAFGYASLAIFIYSAVAIVVDAGVTAAVARLPEGDDADLLVHLHLFSVGVAVSGGAVMVGLRSSIARILGAGPGAASLASYEMFLVIPVIAMSLQAVPRGLLVRRGQYRRLALADLFASTISYAGCLMLAILHRGSADALVLQLILIGVFRFVFIVAFSKWMSFRLSSFRSEGWRETAAFLRGNWTYNVSTFLARNADNVMVSRIIGVTALGFYARAFSLFMAPFTQLQYSLANVMLRWFSFNGRDDRRDVEAKYLALYSSMAALGGVLMVSMIAEARMAVLFLFGEQWLPCVPLVRAFGAALFTQLVLSPVLWFVQARGPAHSLGVLGALNILPLAGVALGCAQHSLASLATWYAAISVAGTLLGGLLVAARVTGISLTTHFAALKGATVGCSLLFAIEFVVGRMLLSGLGNLLLAGCCSAVVGMIISQRDLRRLAVRPRSAGPGLTQTSSQRLEWKCRGQDDFGGIVSGAVVVVVPVGPKCRLDYVQDTINSVIHYTPGPLRFIVVDDSGVGTGDRLVFPPGVSAEVLPPQRRGVLGGLYLNLLSAFKVAAREPFDLLLRIDTDGLAVAAWTERARSALRDRPKVGCLGAHFLEPDGSWRPIWWPRRRILRNLTKDWFSTPRASFALLIVLFTGLSRGYRLGESVLGGVCIYSFPAIRALVRCDGWLATSLADTQLEEDHIFGLLLRARGFSLSDAEEYRIFGATHQGLPASPEEILQGQFALVHSVKSYAELEEGSIRELFRRSRSGAPAS